MDYYATINCTFHVMYCHPEKYILNIGRFFISILQMWHEKPRVHFRCPRLLLPPSGTDRSSYL